MGLVVALLTFVTLFDSVVGVRTGGRIEAVALEQEVRLNKKLDAFRVEVKTSLNEFKTSLNELKDQISKLYDLVSKRRKIGDITDSVEQLK